jgi:acid phosphatase family membrane protein YuiD
LPISAAIVAGLVMLSAFIAAGWARTHKKNIRNTPYRFMQHVSFILAALIASAAIPGSSSTLVPLVAVAAALALTYGFSGKWAVISSVVYCCIMATVLALNLMLIGGYAVL